MLKHALCLTLVPALLYGCSNSGGGGGTTNKDAGPSGGGDAGMTAGQFDPMAVASTLAQAQCAYYTRCVPAIYSAFGWANEAACVSETSADARDQFNFLAPAVTAGRLRYQAAQLDSCVQDLAARDCILDNTDDPCGKFLQGAQAANAPCFIPAECGDNLYCNRTGLGTCGTCAPAAQNQADCAATQGNCVAKTTCVDVGQGMARCVPTDANEGGACLTLATGFCRGNLQCTGPMAGPFTCQRPGNTAGAACTADSSTAPACNLANNLTCIGATCGAATWVGTGGMCGPNTFCTGDSFCPMGGTTCSALPAASQPCGDQGNGPELCGTDTYCSSGTCAPQKSMSTACTASAECIGDLYCIGGTCGPYNWQQCN